MLLHSSHNDCRFVLSKKRSAQMGQGMMWSTHVAGRRIPRLSHSAQSGCSARNALLRRVHRAVWYGSAERCRTYRPSFLFTWATVSQGSVTFPISQSFHMVGAEAAAAARMSRHKIVLVHRDCLTAVAPAQPLQLPASALAEAAHSSQPAESLSSDVTLFHFFAGVYCIYPSTSCTCSYGHPSSG